MKVIPNYHPPSDYRRPTKTQEKVYVPVNDYPEINFSMITNPLTPNLFLAFPPSSPLFGDMYCIQRMMQYVSSLTQMLAYSPFSIWQTVTNT